MNRLNADGHDESQWLPRKWFNPKTQKDELYPIVNKFRAAQGDITRNHDDKLEAARWMPRVLNLNKLIDDDQLHTCKRTERIALSAMAALGIGSLRVFMAAGSDVRGLPEYDPFTIILTGMHPIYSNALMWVICDERNRGNINLAKQMMPSIHTGIELAQKLLDDLEKHS